MKSTITKRPTLKDIAEIAGVSISTASQALRSSIRPNKVGVEAYERILKVAESLNYYPQESARALVTGKTNNIGFLVSSKTTLGFANSYFSTIMAGVQSCCEDRGYHCIIGSSDLSSLDNFIMPKKISRRSVDGFMLVGHIDDGVAQKLIDSNVPFVIIEGKPGYSPPGVLSIKCRWVEKWHRLFEYMYQLGHRRFGCGGIHHERSRELLCDLFENFCLLHRDDKMEMEIYFCREDEYDKFDYGSIIAEKWAKSGIKPTAIMGHDQFCVGFLGQALRIGVKCPRDVSVVSDSETVLCRRFYPRITSYKDPLVENAYNATNVFIDYIQEETTWVEVNRNAENVWKMGDIVEGESTGKI